MDRIHGTDIACHLGYTSTFAVLVSDDPPPVVQPRTVKIFLSWKEPEPLAPRELTEPKGVGVITFGVYRPLSYPGVPLPAALDPDIAAPLRRVWSITAQRPAPWLHARFPHLRPEFLVFASVEIHPDAAGQRIALAVMADLINRHLPPGGIALLNLYPLEFLLVGKAAARDATAADKQRGIAALKRHYSRLGLQTIDSEPDLMVLQRPQGPIQVRRREVRLPRQVFSTLAEVPAYEGRY